MIIKAFAEYIQTLDNKKSSLDNLIEWITQIIEKPATNNIERIIHHEIFLRRNKIGMYILTGNGKSGKILLESLYNFALSYESQNFSRWVHKINASDFVEKL